MGGLAAPPEVDRVGAERPRPGQGLRLAELLAAVSLATDLAHDVAAESALRDAVLSVELAQLIGWPEPEVSDAYYLALLYHIGCTGATAQQSRLGGGDDVTVRRWMSEVDYTNRPQMMRTVATKVAPQWGPSRWVQGTAALATAGRDVPEAYANLAEVAARLSERLGASPGVTDSLCHAYGRWDGKVFTSLPSGEGLSAISRLVHLVHVAQIYHQVGGVEVADAVVRQRSGTEFDPEMAKLWLENSNDLLRSTLSADSVWDAALGAEPEPHRRVGTPHLDKVSAALADFVDLATPFTYGHSARVARLAETAALNAGLREDEAATIRRAGQVHDLGMVSVPHRVWLKQGPLNPAQWERVRTHPYHTQRILSLAEPLRDAASIAGLHHERLDGSGYHRGLQASGLPLGARILAAAEVYQSMSEDRAWRPALEPGEARRQLRDEVDAHRLDSRAVEAVLEAAGQPRPTGRSGRAWPAGLTDREVDVLRAMARGMANKKIATELFVSQATVHTHVINIYGKIGLNTRAGATLFAVEHDLIDSASR
jgi:HD-GYP domain-containing protein (c-di-GMP phosphodiesterase class II)/DNA-binding CsgD family transcriptional regulator